jgi:hypothetical protein
MPNGAKGGANPCKNGAPGYLFTSNGARTNVNNPVLA